MMSGVKDGEISLFFLGNQFSHGILKLPQANNFRVNARFKPVYVEYIPVIEEIELGEKVIEAWPKKRGYFRIDLIRQENKMFIMEVEAVNPSFYLKHLKDKEIFLGKFENFLIEYYSNYRKD